MHELPEQARKAILFFLVGLAGIAAGYVLVSRSWEKLQGVEQTSIQESLNIEELQRQLKEADVMRFPGLPSVTESE